VQTQEFFNPAELHAHLGIREGMHVADFGSGSGEIAIAFAKMVGADGRVTAIDVLPSAIESVTSKAKNENLKNIVAVRGNLEIVGGSNARENSQDVVFLANILWQSKKQVEILQEAVRVLKPGGMFVAIEWKRQSTDLGPPKELRMSDEDLQDLVQKAGLTFTGTFAAGSFHVGLIAKK
jgi:ubiquinone/menaquinone biosynthesis C-methylase UbiE